MNKEKFINNIKLDNYNQITDLVVIREILKNAELVSHYKSVDKRYYAKLETGLDNIIDNKENNCFSIYISNGYKNFEGILNEFEIHIRYRFNNNDAWEYSDQIYYVSNNNKDEILPNQVSNILRDIITRIEENIKQVNEILNNIDENIKQYNKYIDVMIDFNKWEDSFNYIFKKHLPKRAEYISEHYFIN